jgi:uncharacterized repeat protein (TIGR01451 family)
MMFKRLLGGIALAMVAALPAPLFASDLTIGTGGRVTIELIASEAAFRNTLSVVSPGIAVALRGCGLEPADGLTGTHVVSEKLSQRGCRVELDADATTGGIQAFANNTTFQFGFCAQTDADAACEHLWSSSVGSNSDAFDHVRTTQLSPGVFTLAWEDLPKDSSDNDFNDLIVVVRVAQDSDGDGLWDDWETSGIDTDGDGTFDYNLPALGANPLRKDIFIEIDFMDCATAGGDCGSGDNHSHRPLQDAIDAVVDAFAAANVTNAPGQPDGIAMHIDVNNAVPHQNTLVIPNACFVAAAGTGFDAVKNNAANFGPANPRRFTHHYNLWTHQQVATSTSSGCGELPGNDFQVSFGLWNYVCAGGTNANQPCANNNANCPGSTCQAGGDLDGDGVNDQDVGTVAQQAGTLMHELGHNLNLGHGGGDWLNFKPNYLSVMNYSFQIGGVPPTDPDMGGPLVGRVDYSRSTLPTLVENNLTEANGIADGMDNTSFFCPGSATLNGTGNGTGAVNWNCDTDSADTNLGADINADAMVDCVRPGANNTLDTAETGDDVRVLVNGVRSIREGANRQCDTTATGDDVQWRPLGALTGYTDWTNIKYDFQNSRDFDDGTHTFRPAELEELTFERFAVAIEADVALAIAGSPSPVVTGSNITYSVSLTNSRPTAALDVVVQDVLPPSLSFVSCAASGGGVCGGSGNDRTVSFAAIPGGGSATITLVAAVSCTLGDGAVIANTARVASRRDADLSNNAGSLDVTASNPPPVISNVSTNPQVLWPPDHQMVGVAVQYVVTDNCPVTNALAASSNEPVDSIADGSTTPDWLLVDPHQVVLRAERSGVGSGRIYTITVTSTDSGGASSSATVPVVVPRSQE